MRIREHKSRNSRAQFMREWQLARAKQAVQS